VADGAVRIGEAGSSSLPTQTQPPPSAEPETALDRRRRRWREWYHRNKHDQFKKEYFRRTTRRAKARAWLDNYKRGLSCAECGFSNPVALDFHHTDPAGKDFSLADALNVSLSIKRLQKEIQKCVVLCANCHRIEHARLIGM